MIKENHYESWKSLKVTAPQVTLTHYHGDNLSNPMLITAFSLHWTQRYQEPCSEVWSLSPAKRLAGAWIGNLQVCSPCLNPLVDWLSENFSFNFCYYQINHDSKKRCNLQKMENSVWKMLSPCEWKFKIISFGKCKIYLFPKCHCLDY